METRVSLKYFVNSCSMIIVVRTPFYENNKCHPQVFVDECLYKL